MSESWEEWLRSKGLIDDEPDSITREQFETIKAEGSRHTITFKVNAMNIEVPQPNWSIYPGAPIIVQVDDEYSYYDWPGWSGEHPQPDWKEQ